MWVFEQVQCLVLLIGRHRGFLGRLQRLLDLLFLVFFEFAQHFAEIMADLAAIDHVRIVRIHTRVPVAAPEMVTDALGAAMDTVKPLWLVVHANHPREFTAEARAALDSLRRAGMPLLGQSVLLRGVNDSEAALEGLFRAMLAARVKPYYLHQLDPAPGTSRFQVPIEEGLALLEGLRGRVTGLALPTYILDRPGGAGKVALGQF